MAIIENGTRKNQRVLTGTLDELAKLIEMENIISPSLLIIGEVAQLHQQLNWFNKKIGELTNDSSQTLVA